ncbi:MAG: hypothetical protein MUF64_18485 [Polyangiaceae bacterium]|nr:hypothetical protein [Polyangiaceae bacterium]
MRLFPLALVLLSLAGCKASFSANVNANENRKIGDEPPPSQDITALQSAPRTAFIGVTHALSLSEEASAKATCQCMAAAVGGPRDSSFQWRGTPPQVGEDAMVVAINNDKTPCDGKGSLRGPSIQGVEQEGGNVIVYLEEPRPGIPVAHGAVFQRPIGEGYLIFRPGRRLPYGQPLPGSGSAVCRLPLGEGRIARPADTATPASRRGGRAPLNTF